MYKRKASVSGGLGGFLANRRSYKRAKQASKGPYAKRAPYQSHANRTLSTKIKALIAGKTKDAQDVAHNVTVAAADTAQFCCLTNSEAAYSEVAPDLQGLLITDGDSALINSITIRGSLKLKVITDAAPLASTTSRIRRLLVWYKKVKLDPSAGGTLPPVTEVLVSDNIDSLYALGNEGNRNFVVIDDRTWNLGMAMQTTVGGADLMAQGPLSFVLDEVIPVKKTCKFVDGAQSSVSPGGHYSSGNPAGLVNDGLFVMYLVADDDSNNDIFVTMNCRLNYTA